MSSAQVTPERIAEIRIKLADATQELPPFICEARTHAVHARLALEREVTKVVGDLLTALEAQQDAYDRAISNYQAQAYRAESAERQLATVTQERDEAQRAKYGTPCKCESWIETCGQLEAERDALKQERDSWRERYLDKKRDFEKQAESWARDQKEREAERDALKQERDAMRAALNYFMPSFGGEEG